MNCEGNNEKQHRPGSFGRMSSSATAALIASHSANAPRKPEAAAKKVKNGPPASWPRNPKPKRSLSAYNLFFQHEMENIVGSSPSSAGSADNAGTLLSKIISNKGRLQLPSRESDSDSSYVHCRRRGKLVHGKIGFKELARTISKKWKALDESSRAIYDALAILEKKRYERELEAWDRERIAEADRQLAGLEKAEKDGAKASSPSPPPSITELWNAEKDGAKEVLASSPSPVIVSSSSNAPFVSSLSNDGMSSEGGAHEQCTPLATEQRHESSSSLRDPPGTESANAGSSSPPSIAENKTSADVPCSGTWRAVPQHIFSRRRPSPFSEDVAPPPSSFSPWDSLPYRPGVAVSESASVEPVTMVQLEERELFHMPGDEGLQLRLYEPTPIGPLIGNDTDMRMTDDQRMQMQLYSPTPIGAQGRKDFNKMELDKASIDFLASVFSVG